MDLICAGGDGIYGGAPLFMDVTIISPLTGRGVPMAHARDRDGTAVEKVAKDCREKDYPDVQASPHAVLLSLGTETYGRQGSQCLTSMRY